LYPAPIPITIFLKKLKRVEKNKKNALTPKKSTQAIQSYTHGKKNALSTPIFEINAI